MYVFEKGQYSGAAAKMFGEEGVLATVTNYQPGAFNNTRHCHDNAHFSFMLDGACAEKKSSGYEILPGSLVYYSPGEQHQVTHVGNTCRRINIEMEQSFFASSGISDEMARLTIINRPGAGFLMVKMYREFKANDAFSQTSIYMLLLNLLNSAAQPRLENSWPAWAKIVREILHDRWNEPITLQQLSKEAHTSEINISRYFPIYFSGTLGNYMRKLKVEHALGLIKSGSLSLTAIAHECGFADQSHFTRVFKAYIGCLPKEFQKL